MQDPGYDSRTIRVPQQVMSSLSSSQKQYWAAKSQYMDVILFFKVGTFYELYGEPSILFGLPARVRSGGQACLMLNADLSSRTHGIRHCTCRG